MYKYILETTCCNFPSSSSRRSRFCGTFVLVTAKCLGFRFGVSCVCFGFCPTSVCTNVLEGIYNVLTTYTRGSQNVARESNAAGTIWP